MSRAQGCKQRRSAAARHTKLLEFTDIADAALARV
jgi:hypothetical protein